MKKYFYPIFLFFFLLLVVPKAHAFDDILPSHPNFDAISYGKEQGIINGYSNGLFLAENLIHRDEFLKIVLEAISQENKTTNCKNSPFPDVTDYWAVHYVCLGKEKNIITGNVDGKFYPQNNISFIEAAKIISNALDLVTESNQNEWWKPFTLQLESLQSIPVSILHLNEKITRGEMMEIIWRIQKNIKDKTSRTYDDLVKMPIDLDSWQYLGDGYSKDKNAVYFYSEILEGVSSPATFQVLDEISDDSLEYYYFKYFPEHYYTDGKNIFTEGKIIDNTNIKDFIPRPSLKTEKDFEYFFRHIFIPKTKKQNYTELQGVMFADSMLVPGGPPLDEQDMLRVIDGETIKNFENGAYKIYWDREFNAYVAYTEVYQFFFMLDTNEPRIWKLVHVLAPG